MQRQKNEPVAEDRNAEYQDAEKIDVEEQRQSQRAGKPRQHGVITIG